MIDNSGEILERVEVDGQFSLSDRFARAGAPTAAGCGAREGNMTLAEPDIGAIS